jgi:hypothetical protein
MGKHFVGPKAQAPDEMSLAFEFSAIYRVQAMSPGPTGTAVPRVTAAALP